MTHSTFLEHRPLDSVSPFLKTCTWIFKTVLLNKVENKETFGNEKKGRDILGKSLERRISILLCLTSGFFKKGVAIGDT